MRILHVQKVKGIGGSEKHLLSLLPALSASGEDVRMVVLAAGEDEARFISAAKDRAIDTVVTPARRDLDPRPIRAIAREIKVFRPDIVHTHLLHADVWGQTAALLTRTPSVRTIHNVQTAVTGEPIRSASRAAGWIARTTICISERVAGFVAEHHLAPPDRIRVVPYGISMATALPSVPDRAGRREELGIEPSEVVFTIAARLIQGKGHRMAIEAFASVVTAAVTGRARGGGPWRDARLLIAGDGPLRTSLERSTTDDRISFLGHVEDVAALLAASDVLVFPTEPSLGEGFGLAALEAMASGLPVIATRVGALPEIVEDGVTGRLVEPDGRALSDAIAELARDPDLRARMGAAGRARAAQRFSLESMVAKTRDVYREVAAR